MSWLGKLNFYVLQWFTIRLYKEVEILDINEEFNSNLTREDPLPASYKEEVICWGILTGVAPMSGWNRGKNQKYARYWKKNFEFWRRKESEP